MSPLHYIQFLIFSVCISSFTLFMYIVYYGDLIVSYNRKLEPEYDYIIVGSGTAGSLIAHRLATETNFTFAVLEAGGKGNALLNIPVLGPLLHGSVFDWQYETIPQGNACWAMKNNKCKLIQGKIFGGSSKLNNMVHVRGNLSHYASWFHGKHTEDYIRKQFELLENNYLHIENLEYESELAEAVINAAKELGYKTDNRDNSFSKVKLSQKNGQRWSMSDNLEYDHIFTNVLVNKILTRDKKAYGVEFLKSGLKLECYAKKGVIVSAGTYNTPKLLQLSGIGPRSILEPLKTPIVGDLPVGENLQDHVATGLDLILFDQCLKVNALNVINVMNIFHYFLSGQGAFTSPGCEAIGFLSSNNDTTPDLQFMVLPVGISSDRGSHLKNSLNLRDSIWYEYFETLFEQHTATILPIVLHPKSRGTVYIDDVNPEKPPKVDPKYLSNKEDLEVLKYGLKMILKFMSTKSIQDIGGYINRTPFPGCERYELFSDEYWNCYVRHLTLTSYHPVGTCSMGLSDTNSVVDTSFQVHGLKNLFVVDASVLPTLPSGNINAAIAMMASIFFETNINIKNRNSHSCLNTMYEYIYSVCMSSSAIK